MRKGQILPLHCKLSKSISVSSADIKFHASGRYSTWCYCIHSSYEGLNFYLLLPHFTFLDRLLGTPGIGKKVLFQKMYTNRCKELCILYVCIYWVPCSCLQVCVQNQNLQFAFSLFERMKRDQIQPNLVESNYSGYIHVIIIL